MTSPRSKTCGFITKKAINWMRIQKDHFFSHVGNIIRHPPFAKVCQTKRKKPGAFQFLRQKLPCDIEVHTCKKQSSWTRSAVLAEAANDLTSIPVKRYSFHVKKTSPDRSKSHFGGQRTVPGSPSTILTDLESVLDGNPHETTVICSDIPPTSGDREIFESEGNFNYDKTNFQKVRQTYFLLIHPRILLVAPTIQRWRQLLPNSQKPPKAEERKMDWELTSVSHGSHDSHDSLARLA